MTRRGDAEGDEARVWAVEKCKGCGWPTQPATRGRGDRAEDLQNGSIVVTTERPYVCGRCGRLDVRASAGSAKEDPEGGT
jgi:hypothetical protein